MNTDSTAVQQAAETFFRNIDQVLVGKRDTIELVFVALLCEGHVLLEDVPGVGKTMLAKAVAASLGGSFHRVQCTPDLLPSDVTGVQFFHPQTQVFEYRPGPIVANVVIVDEINRAMPRTQSCLLECMEERQVTVDLETRPLPRPFLVLATQNPIESEGTFPLPEAQLDRFLLRTGLGHPSHEEEEEILLRFQHGSPLPNLKPVLALSDLERLQVLCRTVHTEAGVRDYLLRVVRATREHAALTLGASPRASLGLSHAAQALAAIQGRDYVLPDDIKRLAVPTLAHRILLSTEARLHGRTEADIIEEILRQTPVPV